MKFRIGNDNATIQLRGEFKSNRKVCLAIYENEYIKENS